MTILNGSARADVLRGTNGGDWINGGDGDDRIDGGGGADLLFGGNGRDTLNGGSGSDYVDGGAGDDLLIYALGENKGSFDIYNGWTGSDTLRLVFTAAEWARSDVKGDVARFLAYLPEYNEPLGWIDDPVFIFKAFGLSVVGVNKLEVVVDGKVVNVADAPVVTADDVLAVGEDAAGATVDVLANDWAADGVRSVTLAQPAKGKVELVSTNFAAEKPSAVIKFIPGDAYAYLKAGETATEVFTYTVTDKDGDKKAAAVTVTITGANDAPVAKADVGAMTAGSVLTGSVATNDRDVDGDQLSYYADWSSRPEGFEMESDGSWTFDPLKTDFWTDHQQESAVKRLAAGETMTFEIAYTVYDTSYAATQSTLTITVTGVNDAPILNAAGDYVREENLDYLDEEPAVFVTEGSFSVLDWDGERGAETVTLLDAPDDYLGTLVLTGWNADEERWTYRFEIDTATLRALGEGEEVVQTYQVRMDDGQGGVVTDSFDVVIIGDGNDSVSFPGWPLFPNGPTDADGYRTETFHIPFDDDDLRDVHTAAVEWLDPHSVGEIAALMTVDENGERLVSVTYRVPLDQIDAIPSGVALAQRFRLTVTDAAGSSDSVEYDVDIHREQWQVGAEGDERITGYDSTETRDVLVGGEGADQLVGGDGRDVLFGDTGPALPDGEENTLWWTEEWTPVPGFNDELDGGAGADRLTGGGGADRFLFRRGEAEGDVVTDFSRADGDKLVFFDWGEGAAVDRVDATRWRVTSGDGAVSQTITVADAADLSATDFVFEERAVEWRIGGDGDDRLNAGDDEFNHVLVGEGGRDRLRGGDGRDELYGDAGPALPDGVENLFDGSSHRSSGDYDDELDGEGGADLLVGGAGGDLFNFDMGEADGDVIRDFNGAEGDRLDLSAWDWEYGAVLRRLDANRWEISADGVAAEVITLENGAELLPEYVIFSGDFLP